MTGVTLRELIAAGYDVDQFLMSRDSDGKLHTVQSTYESDDGEGRPAIVLDLE